MKWLRALIGKFSALSTAWIHPDGTVRFANCILVEPRLVDRAEGHYLHVGGETYKLKRLPVEGWPTEDRAT